ncbi:hypothetical protein CSB09_00940 [Candidatus Gracilibacteria bacterium]|nr:MAG: hypothetical protein CSB09_00940 [Candidatus Gracilibacteria bacterium]
MTKEGWEKLFAVSNNGFLAIGKNVDENEIIYINKENLEWEKIKDYKDLYEEIKNYKYIFVDEIEDKKYFLIPLNSGQTK